MTSMTQHKLNNLKQNKYRRLPCNCNCCCIVWQ